MTSVSTLKGNGVLKRGLPLGGDDQFPVMHLQTLDAHAASLKGRLTFNHRAGHRELEVIIGCYHLVPSGEGRVPPCHVLAIVIHIPEEVLARIGVGLTISM